MDRLEQVKDDLHFVRAVVAGGDRGDRPATIYFLWAILGLCGFALVDFRDTWVPVYWSIAGPLGFVASACLGWRHGRRTGQMTASGGTRHLLHWAAC